MGGGNRIEMKKLKQTFESLGFKNVHTYINSGNVIFESTKTDAVALSRKIEGVIVKDFKLSIAVLVHDSQTIKKLCEKVPNDWINGSDTKTDVIFLWSEIDNKKILKEFPANPDIETLIYAHSALVWNIERANYGKSKVPKVIMGKIYKQMTIRNINTLRKLNSLLLE